MMEWILSSSVLILVIVSLRFILRGKIGLRLQYALWALVLLRLLVPISFGSTNLSIVNVMPKAERYSEDLYINTPPEYSVQRGEQEIYHGSERPPDYVLNDILSSGGDYNVSYTVRKLSVQPLLRLVWFVGSAIIALVFFISNIQFGSKLKKSRDKVDKMHIPLPVYVTEKVDTPCLFGLVRPAIYVMPEVTADETVLHHALEHETTHFRHGDHVWSLLRCLCLALHWYNPLVWLAIILSRRDSELACDEGTIQRLGEDKRFAYGNTLINLTLEKRGVSALFCTATTMTGRKKGIIKERIRSIAKKPKMLWSTVLVTVFIVAFAVGCTFTGANTGGPWNWAQELKTQDVISVTPLNGRKELPEKDLETLVSLLNALKKGDFTENKQLEGGTPEYGLVVKTADGTYCLNASIAPQGSLEMNYGDKQWWINSEALSAFIRGMTSADALTGNVQVQEHIEPLICLDNDVPDAVIQFAMEYVSQKVNRWNSGAASEDDVEISHIHKIVAAKVTGLTRINTGTAGLNNGIDMYLLEYRLLPEDQTGIVAAGDRQTELIDGQQWLTEWSSAGQPYLLLHWEDRGSQTVWECIGEVSTLTMQEKYCAPEMLEQYGNMYTAAAMELYAKFRGYADSAPYNSVCIAVKPTGRAQAGDDYTYFVPEAQEKWISAWEKAISSAEKDRPSDWDWHGQLGIWVIYQDEWMQLMQNGMMAGHKHMVNADDGAELYALVLEAARAAGVGEVVCPEDIRGIKSATLDWNGMHTLTDPGDLIQLEEWLANSEECYGGTSCWFTALLTLELEDGRCFTLSMATDSCFVWMSEGVCYQCSPNDNAVFYSMFAAEVIHDAVREGMDTVGPLLPYMNWSRYADHFGPEEAFSIMNMLGKWATEDGISESTQITRYMAVMLCTNGLDGACRERYAQILDDLCLADGDQFARCCLGNIGEEQGDQVVELLALSRNTSQENIRAGLESRIGG